MKKIFFIILSVGLMSFIKITALAQDKGQLQTIEYSKYIGKTVKEFFSDFNLKILDTVAVREFAYISGFILKLEKNTSIEIYPKLVYDSIQFKKMDDKFNVKLFYPNTIKCIRYKKNGKTLRVYGKYNRA